MILVGDRRDVFSINSWSRDWW